MSDLADQVRSVTLELTYVSGSAALGPAGVSGPARVCLRDPPILVDVSHAALRGDASTMVREVRGVSPRVEAPTPLDSATMAAMRAGEEDDDLYVILRRSSLSSEEEYTGVEALSRLDNEEVESAENMSRTVECDGEEGDDPYVILRRSSLSFEEEYIGVEASSSFKR